MTDDVDSAGAAGGRSDAGDPTGVPTVTVGPDDTEVPRYVWLAFWKVAALVNAGVLAVAVGAMLIGFEGRLEVGGGAVVAGLAVLGYAAVQYRVFLAYDRARND